MTAVVGVLIGLAAVFAVIGLAVPDAARWALTVAFVLFAAGIVADFIEEEDGSAHG